MHTFQLCNDNMLFHLFPSCGCILPQTGNLTPTLILAQSGAVTVVLPLVPVVSGACIQVIDHQMSLLVRRSESKLLNNMAC